MVIIKPEGRFKCGKMYTAPWQQLSAPLKMALMTPFNAFLITALRTSKSSLTNKFHFTFNYFQIVKFKFKFELRITIKKILMA